LITAGTTQAQSTTSWNFGTTVAPTASADVNGTDVLGLAVSQGNNNGTTVLLTTTSQSSGYTGASGAMNAGAAARIGDLNTAAAGSAYFEFTLEPQNGATITVTEISFGTRSTSTGPQAFTIRSDEDSYVADIATGAIGNNATWSLKTASSLSIAFSAPRTFRIYGHNGTGSPGAGTANWRIDDLKILTTTSSGPDVIAPTLDSLSPANTSTGVLLGANLTATFSEAIQKIAGSGVIELRKANNDLVESFGIDDATVTVSGAQLTINPSVNLDYSTSYYVVFVPTSPATALVEDLAGNDFVGLQLSTDWTFTTEAAPPPPSVVINKYYNTGSSANDLIELLVVGNGITGTTLDMRGMIVKDFSVSGTSDGGGKFEFTTNALWEAVPVGTLITLRNAATSADTTVNTGGGDFTLDVGLTDTTYFTSLGGSFDIATRDFVMIKAAGSGSAGTTGGIHAFAATDGSPAPTLFDGFSGQKLLAGGTTGTGVSAQALNSTSSIADYNGTGAATGGLTPAEFGIPHNATNASYVFTLRGVTPGDGSGVASIVNSTAPFTGVNIFPANTPSTAAQITVNAQIPGITLTDVVVTVPTELGAPAGAVLSGPGADAGIAGITGQVITISGVAVTNVNTLTIAVSGLATPVTTVSDNGNYTFTVQTAISGGTPTSIANQPAARVIIPMDAIRDNDANGVPLDLGTVVAIEGICTEAQFFTANTVAHLQLGTQSMTVFNTTATGNPFVRGKRYAVVGTVGHFNGLTQVALSSFANVVDLGADTEPTPTEVTIPDLVATPEAYEGRLVKILNVSRDPSDTDIWAANAFITIQDTASPTPNTFEVFIGTASGALTNPTGSFNLTGIFSQNDASSPYLEGYRIMPREEADIELLGSGYSAWIAGFYPGETDPLIIGQNADPDKDGRTNLVEAYTGGAPNVVNDSPISQISKSGDTLFFYIQKAKTPVAGLTGSYEWSTGLGTWNASGAPEGGVTVNISELIWDDSATTYDLYQVKATASPAAPDELFVRLEVED
jgi:hypothetical protein